MDKELIRKFLREVSLENATWGTNRLGAIAAKAGARVGMSLASFNEENDQLLVSAPNDEVLPILAGVLKKFARALKDPVEFGAPHATFCMLTGQKSVFGQWGHPSLVFAYVKPLTDATTHILLEAYSNDYGGTVAKMEIKRLLKELALRFHG